MTVKIYEYGHRVPCDTSEQRIHPMSSVESISNYIYGWLGFAVKSLIVDRDKKEIEVRLKKGCTYE